MPCESYEICRDLSFSETILEGDEQVIINTVNDANEDLSYCGSIIKDIKKFYMVELRVRQSLYIKA